MAFNARMVELLTELKVEMQQTNTCLCDIKDDMKTDRVWLWRILALTISGAFALVGIKMLNF